ncbi:MAG: sigma-70 family RNA polymerase sigma factor [Gemmatimonadales bacterium]|nr:sigma-70 family RNA polymerase sigma factor [Gemmatimonadales bacterium]
MSAMILTETKRNTEDRNRWAQFAAKPTQKGRQELVGRYLKLLYQNAAQLSRKIPTLDRGEAISSGFLGLSQAIDRFEPARGLSFSTFACPRIRGAVLDEVRRQSPVSRPANDRRREVGKAERRVAARTLRRPEGREVACELGVSLNEYWTWQDERYRGMDLSLHETSTGTPDGEPRPIGDVLPDPDSLDFSDAVEQESTWHLVRRAVTMLPHREREAVELHYLSNLPFREVGARLGVSAPRACEIAKRGVQMLRQSLAAMTAANTAMEVSA